MSIAERALREPREVPHDVELGVVGQRQIVAQQRSPARTSASAGAGGHDSGSRGRADPTRRSAACQNAGDCCIVPSCSVERRRRAHRSPAVVVSSVAFIRMQSASSG